MKLRDRRARDKTGEFLIEGYRELLAAVDNGWEVRSLFYCPKLFLGGNEMALLERSNAELIEVTPEVFEKMSYRDRPDGLLGVAPQKKRALEDLSGDFFALAEAIEKPGNLGTILRSCDAAGVDGLIVVDRCTDIFNPNVVRASVGTLFTVPVVEATSAEALAWLEGVDVLAATPQAEVEYTEVDMTRPIAIAVGTEQVGLTEKWMEKTQVKIPMLGKANSLNVATATTLMLYEAVRQRRLSR